MTGNYIKTSRQFLNLTQAKLAELIGAKASDMRYWENGMRIVPNDKREALSNIFAKIPASVRPQEKIDKPAPKKSCPDFRCVYNSFPANGVHYCPFGKCPRLRGVKKYVDNEK